MTADRRNGNPGRRQADTIAAAAAVDRVLEMEKRLDTIEDGFKDHIFKQDREFAELRERDVEMSAGINAMNNTLGNWTVTLHTLERVANWGGRFIAGIVALGGLVAAFLALKGASGK